MYELELGAGEGGEGKECLSQQILGQRLLGSFIEGGKSADRLETRRDDMRRDGRCGRCNGCKMGGDWGDWGDWGVLPGLDWARLACTVLCSYWKAMRTGCSFLR